MKQPRILIHILFAILLFCPAPVFAAELKITDNLGLVRAAGAIAERAVVLVRTQNGNGAGGGTPSKSPVLEQTDGILPDLKAEDLGSGQFRFSGVQPGVWRIKVSPGVLVSEVKIEE